MSDPKEERWEERRDFLTRSLLTLIKLARNQASPDLDQALLSLQRSISAESELHTLESLMGPVKDEILRLQLGMERQPPKPAPDQTAPLEESAGVAVDELKQFYIEILNQLDVDLNPDYRSQLDALRGDVSRARGADELFGHRPRFEKLVRQYAQSVFEERKKAAAFISEIAERLAELEKHLAASVQRARQDLQENQEFSHRLEKHVNQTAASVHQADGLEELKNMVLARLKTISEAVRKKRRRDQARAEGTNREISDVKTRFGDALAQVDQAGKENEALIEKLKFDGLTGAYNRILFEEYLGAEMCRYDRYSRMFSLIIFDVDHFKQVNDNHGHAIGDKCLKEVIGNIRRILRENDILARYGGDEFVIILPETGTEQCVEVAEKVRRAIEDTDFTVRGQRLPLTISVGVAGVTTGDQCGEDILERADQALYQAKKQGRNRVGVA